MCSAGVPLTLASVIVQVVQPWPAAVKIIHELLLVGVCAHNATNESKMQRRINLFASAYSTYDLTIGTKKTEMMHQPPPGATYMESSISVQGQNLAVMEKFEYLGSTPSNSTIIDGEVNHPIVRVSAAFG